MEKSGLIPENAEPSTTSLILNKDELEALMIAISDSMHKSITMVENPLTTEEIKEMADEELTDQQAQDLRAEVDSLAESQIAILPGILKQIQEVLPEVEDNDKLRKPPFIIG